MDEIGHEEQHEGYGGSDEAHTATRTDILVVDVVHDVEDAQHTGEEYNGEAEDEHPGIEQGIEAVRGIGPTRDDRCETTDIDEVVFFDDEVRALEEGGDGTSQEQRAYDTI